jgi:integrase/recombinase XerC
MAPFLLLKDFIVYLEIEKRYSKHTLLAYQKDLEQFIEFSSERGKIELSKIARGDVRSWIVGLSDDQLENKSINRKLSALRSFFKWLKKEKIVESSPLLKITGPKNAKRLPGFAKESELASERIEPLFSKDFNGLRDQVMVELFYQTGIRLSELLQLKNDQLSQVSIKVLGKRNKERLIPISKELADLIGSYCQVKQKMGLDSSFLLVTEKGNNLYAKFVYRRINHYLRRATSLEKCSPHVLRHTFATHLLNNGAGLETLKNLLGHANLSATQVYTHNSFAQLTNIYSQAHPRGAKID